MKNNKIRHKKILSLISVLSLLILTQLFSYSCRNEQEKKALQKIDSLIVINDSVGVFLSQIDSSKVLASRELFADNWKIINDILDSIDDAEMIRNHEYWDYITTYEANNRALRKLLLKFNNLNYNHRTNSVQLATFRQSLRRSQIPTDSLDFYISLERAPVIDVERESYLYMPALISSFNALDSLHQYAPDAIREFRKLNMKLNQ